MGGRVTSGRIPPTWQEGLKNCRCDLSGSSHLVCWPSSALVLAGICRFVLVPWCEVVRVDLSPTVVVRASDLPKPFHKNPELHKGRSASRANAARYQQNSDPPVRLSSWAGGPNKVFWNWDINVFADAPADYILYFVMLLRVQLF